jgi:hypothetical protein
VSQLVELSTSPLRPASGWPKRLATVALLGTLAGWLLWAGMPPCPTAALTGLPCPGCGLTRAALALLGGDPSRAAQLHPLIFVLLPLTLGAGAWAAAGHVLGRPPKAASRTLQKALGLGAALLFVLLLALWLLRFAGYFGGPVAVEPAFSGLTR